jgi:hypothetical protein
MDKLAPEAVLRSAIDAKPTHVTATGYVVGGGFEHKLNAAWSLKVEYQYLNFGKDDPVSIDPPGVKFSSFATTTVENDAFHTVRLGLNYKFASYRYAPLGERAAGSQNGSRSGSFVHAYRLAKP